MRDQGRGGRRSLPHCRGDRVNADRWNAAIRALLLVRLGQELGAETQLTRAVRDLVVALLAVLG